MIRNCVDPEIGKAILNRVCEIEESKFKITIGSLWK